MRFAFVLTNLAGGGAEKAVLNVARGLHGRGHDVDLILLEAGGSYPPPEGVGVHVLVSGVASRGWFARRLLAWRLAGKVRRLAPDLVVSTLPFADEVAVLAGLPNHWCRIANTLSAEIDRLEAVNPAKAARRRARYRAMYGRRRLIAVSSGVAVDLQERLALGTALEVIPNPFDFEQIREAARESCAGVPATPYVVHVGRFSAQKRHDLLLDAWQHLATDRKLVLLTAPDEALRRLIEVRGLTERVVVAGFQANPYPWMAGADLLVLCSDHEGLPNVLIEALICGTPVVSTDCPSGPREILGEVLPQALVPCGNAALLAERIAQFLAVPPDLAGVDLQRFNVAHALDAYERLPQPLRRAA